jgi:predicted RNase H-like HicB family nuclease
MTQTLPQDKTAAAPKEPAHSVVHSVFASIRRLFGAEKAREQVGPIERGTWELTLIIEPDDLDGGFVAECAEVTGAMGQGETEQEAVQDLMEAINAIVEVRLREEHPPIAGATSGRRVVNVRL